jgi:hypothetical protein
MNNKSVLLLCLLLLTACHRANEKVVVTRPASPVPTTQTPRQPGRAPTETELRATLQRTYADAVTIDSSRSTPFMTGDFNGDNSEDIAIVVKPRNGKLSELNGEYTNWILEDPHHVQQISRNVKANDVLLAVIHGHNGEGWRHDLARQTYLLKNAVGTEFAAESVKQLKTSGESRLLPQLRGDVIREKLNGSDGILYWTGAKYAWHPVS